MRGRPEAADDEVLSDRLAALADAAWGERGVRELRLARAGALFALAHAAYHDLLGFESPSDWPQMWRRREATSAEIMAGRASSLGELVQASVAGLLEAMVRPPPEGVPNDANYRHALCIEAEPFGVPRARAVASALVDAAAPVDGGGGTV